MTDALVVIIGVFIVSAFSLVIMLLRRKKLALGYWPLIAAVGAFITIGELFGILGVQSVHRVFILITMSVFGTVALLKFWETISIDY